MCNHEHTRTDDLPDRISKELVVHYYTEICTKCGTILHQWFEVKKE